MTRLPSTRRSLLAFAAALIGLLATGQPASAEGGGSYCAVLCLNQNEGICPDWSTLSSKCTGVGCTGAPNMNCQNNNCEGGNPGYRLVCVD